MEQIKEKYSVIKSFIQHRDYHSIQKTLTHNSRARQILNYKDLDGRSLIFHSTFIPDQEFNIRVFDLFVRLGADPKDREINKQSILYYISRDNKITYLKKVLKHGFNLNDNDYMNQTPLFYSAKQGNIEISKILIENGCDVNHKDTNGQTCLFYAAKAGQLQMCKLLANNNTNMLHQNKNRIKASHYAKIEGHLQIVEYLNQFKYEAKKIKQDKGGRDSSMNEKKKKKESSKNQYSLAYCNQDGQVIELTAEQLIQFCRASQNNEKIYQMIRNPDIAETDTQFYNDKKFEKIALKIVNYFCKLENGYLFHEPVDYVKQNLVDYTKIVKYPMDFGTIKKKLTYNAYQSDQQFKNDMHLVFDNCILYNGMQSAFGKIAMQMKLQFNNIYMKELYNIVN